MREKVNKVLLFLKGKEYMTDWGRFCFFALFVGCVHLILAALGAVMCCLPLAAANLLVSALDFLIIGRSKKCKSYFGWIGVVYFGTCVQSLLSCYLLGWTYGFSLYNLVMIPVLFYVMYLTEHVVNPQKYALIYTLVNCVATLILRKFVYEGKPVYEYPVYTDFKISFINNIICFLILVCFSTLFILELTANRKELEEQNEKLIRLANYDELTKLRNRRSILDEWKNLKRSDYCVVMGDIDDFKKINDTYGHEQGDEVLKVVSSCMAHAVEPIDYVSRWGGEEFLMIVFGNMEYALKVVGKIQQDLKRADLEVEGQKIVVTMTFGISERDSIPDGDIDELIRQADHRLYQGKRSGKNCIICKDT